MEQGVLINGRYEILRELGRGGMSTVYLVYDNNLRKEWALKLVPKVSKLGDNIEVNSVMAEIELLKKLDFIYIPKIVDVLSNDESIFVIMDYVDGVSLTDYLISNKKADQEDVVAWGVQLALTLDFLHNQEPPIIYRDMKPSNVMLQSNGNIKLLDFGVSKEVVDDSAGHTIALGTKGYAAPEQFGEKAVYTPQSDIYSLGMTLFQCLTGVNPSKYPERVKPIRQIDSSLSSGLEQVILKATATDPKDRYQSAGALLFALENYHKLDDEVYDSMVNEVKKYKRSKVFMFILLGLSLVLGGASFFVGKEVSAQKVAEARNLKTPDAYMAALDLVGNDITLLNEYVDLVRQTGVFTKDDETNILHYLSKIELGEDGVSQEEYGKLMFNVGKLYWFYYTKDGVGVDSSVEDYKDNTTLQSISIRGSKAYNYFEKAASVDFKDKSTAVVLGNVAGFYRSLKVNVEEAGDAGMYKVLFENLNSMVVLDESSGELPLFETLSVVTSAVDMFAPNFSRDGITEEAQLKLVDLLKGKLGTQEATSEKTQSIKEYVSKKLNGLDKRVKDVYNTPLKKSKK